MCIDGKCRHLKIFWPEKGLCGRCLSEFIDWRCSQSCWYFRPELWTVALLTFSLVQLHTPASLPCVNKDIVYTCTVWKGRRVWGSGLQTDKHLPQSPFTGNFFRWRHFAYEYYLSTSLLYSGSCGLGPLITQRGSLWGYEEPSSLSNDIKINLPKFQRLSWTFSLKVHT